MRSPGFLDILFLHGTLESHPPPERPTVGAASGFRFLEAAAVVLNLLYTLLYLRQSPACYFFGVAGPLVLALLSYRRGLFADIALQLVYVALAVYGYLGAGGGWNETHWSVQSHLLLAAIALASGLVAGALLKKHTRARLPYADSLITAAGIAGSWAMVNYVHANWLYFMAVNACSIALFASRKLFLVSLLHILYLAMSIDGYFRLHWFYP